MIFGLQGEADPNCADGSCSGLSHLLTNDENALYNAFARQVSASMETIESVFGKGLI